MIEATTQVSRFRRFDDRFMVLRQLLHNPAAVIALLIVFGVVVMALFAPYVAPHDPYVPDVDHVLEGPSSAHLIGTDYIGRDMLSRVIYGARTALSIALPAVSLAFVLGLVLGLAAGYLGGLVDKIAIVVSDTLLSIPGIFLAFVLLPLFGPSKPVLIVVIALATLSHYARLSRAQTLAAKQNLYVKAERSLGVPRSQIVLRHVLPNIIPPLLVVMALDVPGAIGLEAGLAFLGIGIQPPTADWGIMLNDGFKTVRTSPWGLIGPIAVVALFTTAFTLLGETLRDITDPRLAGTRRRRFRRRARTS